MLIEFMSVYISNRFYWQPVTEADGIDWQLWTLLPDWKHWAGLWYVYIVCHHWCSIRFTAGYHSCWIWFFLSFAKVFFLLMLIAQIQYSPCIEGTLWSKNEL